jgi:antitoxin FitA
MAKVIQVRNVPDAVHETLSRRAAAHGLSLSDFVARELVAVAGRESNVDVLHALAALAPVLTDRESAADIVRSIRDEREEELAEHVGRP